MSMINFIFLDSDKLRNTSIDVIDFGENARTIHVLKSAKLKTAGDLLDIIENIPQLKKEGKLKGMGGKVVENMVYGIVRESMKDMNEYEKGCLYLKLAEINGIAPEALLKAFGECDE